MSYYDPDSILTTHTKVPCTFNLSVPGLGYLAATATNAAINPSDSSASPSPAGQISATGATALASGTTIPLPLWLGTLLAVSNASNLDSDPFVSLDFPAALSTSVLNALKADPVSVDVRAQSPHFYDLGTRLLELFEEDELVDVLSDTFKARAAKLADYASHGSALAVGGRSGGGGAGSVGGEDFLRGLDENERRLFVAAHDGAARVRDWVASLKQTT
ncbi:hypothetical protein DV738_g384, partial [Chaetothyriales sp. CBS 135597]